MDKLKKSTYRLRHAIKVFWKSYIVVDRRFLVRRRFKHDDIKLGLRLRYPLHEGSVVFDLGGYTGEWAQKIWDMYHATIYVFEPVKAFYEEARMRFDDNSKVRIFNFGLSDKNELVRISLKADASSVYGAGESVEIELRDVREVCENLGVVRIDLLKLNVEGGEYAILPRMIESGLIAKCTDIQVQFHDFYPDAIKLREEIRNGLAKTHHLAYDYPFVFENWRKND